MNCVVCGKPNPRGGRWQVCSATCEMVRAKMYLPSPKASQGHCAKCGKIFKKPWPKSKYCSAECRCKHQNKLSSDARKVELKELTVFRKGYFKMHTEIANRDPDLARHEARIAYLATFYANDEHGARVGLQRSMPIS